MEQVDEALELEEQELIKKLQESLQQIQANCKKANILICGATGSGKSTLTNAVFGMEIAQSGVGLPVTQHFSKFEPKDKNVVIYDSKGLEFMEHEVFMRETASFFIELRKKPDIAEHIHVIWYCINAAKARFDPFEVDLIQNVFAPTPVVFVLNKADIANAKHIVALKSTIEEYNFSNTKGIHVTIAHRFNKSDQSWCPNCLGDEVAIDSDTLEIECLQCSFKDSLKKDTHGIERVINSTIEQLPSFAVDAFIASQSVSMEPKIQRCLEIALQEYTSIKMDLSPNGIKKVTNLGAKFFTVYGFPMSGNLLADIMVDANSSFKEMQESGDYKKITVFISIIDTISMGFLSKVIACFLAKMIHELCQERYMDVVLKASNKDYQVKSFNNEDNDNWMYLFLDLALTKGCKIALQQLWNLSYLELQDMMAKKEVEGWLGMGIGAKKPELDEQIFKQLVINRVFADD